MSAASVFPARALLPGTSFQVLNLPSHYCSSPHTTQRTPSLFVAREKDCTVMYFAQTLYYRPGPLALSQFFMGVN